MDEVLVCIAHVRGRGKKIFIVTRAHDRTSVADCIDYDALVVGHQTGAKAHRFAGAANDKYEVRQSHTAEYNHRTQACARRSRRQAAVSL